MYNRKAQDMVMAAVSIYHNIVCSLVWAALLIMCVCVCASVNNQCDVISTFHM